MARKMKKFATGGSDRYQSRYDRKTKDIESDYQKALKAGKEAGVAKAKYEQRMADAKDDLAKWTKADRSQTSAAEKAAERNLSEARRTKGESMRRSDAFGAKLEERAGTLSGNTGKVEAVKTSDTPATSFAAAFRAARADKGPGSTFTWNGKSYSTNRAGEGAAKPAARSTGTARTTGTSGGATVSRGTSSGTTTTSRGTSGGTSGGTTNKAVTPAKKDTPKVADTSSPWAKDAKGNWKDPSASGSRMLDVLSLGVRPALRGSTPPQSGAYGALSNYYKSKDTAEAAAKQKADADREARRKAAVAGGEQSGYLKLAGMKKGGKVKKYAKGGKIDGCAIRGKTRA